VLWTRCGGAATRYRRRGCVVVEGDAQSVRRPLSGFTRASASGGQEQVAAGRHWGKRGSVQTCQKRTAAMRSMQAKARDDLRSENGMASVRLARFVTHCAPSFALTSRRKHARTHARKRMSGPRPRALCSALLCFALLAIEHHLRGHRQRAMEPSTASPARRGGQVM
jgi:hypothetical protein